MSDIIQPELRTDWGKRLFGLILTSNLTRGQTKVLCTRASGRPQSIAYYDDAIQLVDAVIACKPLVTPEQFEIGMHTLQNIVYTPSGAERKTTLAREFTRRDLSLLDSAFKIELVGFDTTYMGGGIDRYEPEYRLYGVLNRRKEDEFVAWFDYVHPSWQAQRGGFHITDRGST